MLVGRGPYNLYAGCDPMGKVLEFNVARIAHLYPELPERLNRVLDSCLA